MPSGAADDSQPPEDDERDIELSALCATFPEIAIDANDPYKASLDLPVVPTIPVKISFTGEAVRAASLDNSTAEPEATHHLEYLPSIHVKFSLPVGYPASKPPTFHLSTFPAWLSRTVLDHLQAEGERLWEEFGHDQVLFAFLDMLQDAAAKGFEITEGGAELDVCQSDKIALLDFNIKAKQEAFDKETFECGICLDPKKGSVCHKMADCGHIFCRLCLRDFYNNAITTGDLATVRCLAPNCAKERDAPSNPVSSKSRKPRKPKTFVSPSELLQIPLEQEMVKRYVTLRHKAQLESDKNTVYCPRKWCQGGARSKKHRKPVGLEIIDDSESESEDESKHLMRKGVETRGDLMRICEDCGYAFCERCFQGWHGEYFLCAPRQTTGELTEEDKLSLEYVRMHSTPCPTCSVPAQKTHGCNHMICFRCGTHFCYLCSAWLLPENPYMHYNVATQGCYMRLWELEGGDGDDVGIGFGGGARVAHAIPEELNEEDDLDAEARLDALWRNRAEDRRLEPPVAVGLDAWDGVGERPARQPEIVQHVREGPLVLRIDHVPARPPVQEPAPRRPPPIDRHQAAAIARAARRQIEGQNAGQNQALVDVDAPQPRRRAQRHQEPRRNLAQPGQPLRHHENDLIRDARRFLQDVDQRRRENRDLPQDAAVRQLLQRPPPAHENMNNAELLQQREWLERFVQLALNDEEDEWDSDEDGWDDGAWEIALR